MKNYKVFILQKKIPNYRISFFNKLFENKDIDFTIFYSNLTKNEINEGFNQDVEELKILHKRLSNNLLISQLQFLYYIFFHKPDLVISGLNSIFSLASRIFCKLLSVNFMWWYGGCVKEYSDFDNLKQMYQGRLKKFKNTIYFSADALVVYSDYARNFIKKYNLFKKEVFVAHNSPDTDTLIYYKKYFSSNSSELDALKKEFISSGEKIILMLGRLNQKRNTKILLNAFQIVQHKYNNVHLIIAGDGNKKQELEDYVINTGIKNVHFTGEVIDLKTLSKFYMLSYICCTPGIASLSIKEAMTFGKPVITASHGLEMHIIENGINGFIVPLNDAGAMADKINLLLEDEIVYKRISQKAENTILSKVNINSMVNGFISSIYYFKFNKKL